MFDVNKVRGDFPMFRSNPDLIYFDNAATTLKPQPVIDAVTDFYTKHTSNVHRGDYGIAVTNDRLYDGARKSFARLIHCEPDEIAYTHNVTQSLNEVAYAMQHTFLKPGDVVLTTKAEHASCLLPWFRMEKEYGIRVEYIPTDGEARISIDDFKKTLHPGVKAVCVAQMTNVLGSVQPIREMTKAAHAAGAYMIVDGAQSVPHLPVDVKDLDVDFLCFSVHKMCGPSGVGILYGKKELLDRMDPQMLGGDMNARFEDDGSMILKETPVKFEAGTPNIEGVIGAAAAADYLLSLGMDNIEAYEMELRRYFCEKMLKLDNVVLYNPDNEHGPIDFNVKDPKSGKMIFAQDAAGYLAAKNVAVRSGNHCAKILHHIIGTDQTVRASLYFYNTEEEVDRAVQVISEVSLENAVGIFF
ncbi:MAG: cysteine desulfurase [Galactobacillus timonensis]|uniref:aminotransferase class V-fold PLP-dependent enzyme n=1 Tax=Galactobacillus timonensis TaxID=2041840 RepID=UPI00240A7413|nr:cysteine desulfurase [Galactobacillus timonensis]MDD5850907.1 cysteine desulfurase [Galactobacillus timonensis]MDD6599761.1 cysteine desulfurase [Galactobacillus timonensis]